MCEKVTPSPCKRICTFPRTGESGPDCVSGEAEINATIAAHYQNNGKCAGRVQGMEPAGKFYGCGTGGVITIDPVWKLPPVTISPTN
jgi:hypothetical protein